MPTLTSTATHAATAAAPSMSLADFPAPDGAAPFAHASAAALPSAHTLLFGHTLGDFFVLGQAVTEIFSVFDGTVEMAEAMRLTRHAAAMKVASLRSGSVGPQRTFELASARLLEPRPVLKLLVNNVYAEAAQTDGGA